MPTPRPNPLGSSASERLGAELAESSSRRKRVLVLEPGLQASLVMGLNPMDTARAPRVVEASYREVRAALESPRLQRVFQGES